MGLLVDLECAIQANTVGYAQPYIIVITRDAWARMTANVPTYLDNRPALVEGLAEYTGVPVFLVDSINGKDDFVVSSPHRRALDMVGKSWER